MRRYSYGHPVKMFFEEMRDWLFPVYVDTKCSLCNEEHNCMDARDGDYFCAQCWIAWPERRPRKND